MASLLVIRGVDQGKRFELKRSTVGLGRDSSNAVRLHDNEVSRRHAEVRRQGDAFELVDLKSANGTFLNDEAVRSTPLKPGDKIRVGQSTLVFQDVAQEPSREATARVDLLERAGMIDRSAIVGSVPASEGSRFLDGSSDDAGGWLQDRLVNLSVLYKTTQAISHVGEIDTLLPQILQLAFESIGADRAAILLRGADDPPGAELSPKAVRWRHEVEDDERLSISQTIVDHVLREDEGIITFDAPADARFGRAHSIVDFGVREAMCVPIKGRHGTLGVLYADLLALSDPERSPTNPQGARRTRFSRDQLMLMVAIGHQAGLAIENTWLYEAKIQAERLAAVGQTIATLSHHIKNILQGVRGGGYLVEMGLNSQDDVITRRGWGIVEKNQAKIYNLVMDMLSYSKEREPAFEVASLNETIGDVVELMASRAADLGVELAWEPAAGLPTLAFDPEGIHRAALNIVTNAIDACEGVEAGKVVVSTRLDAGSNQALVLVGDNGMGIPDGELGKIFQVFASTKGSRGTGLGLPVSQKVVREHGGQITIESEVGKGSTFTIALPIRDLDPSRESSINFLTGT